MVKNQKTSLSTRLSLHAKRLMRRFNPSKRQVFVVVTFILTCGMMLTQMVSADKRYIMAFVLAVLTYGLSAFALREDLRNVEWMTLLTLPTLFTASTVIFYFLLPARWLTRLPIALLYAVGMYGLLLTENIYNIAVNRTIALLRAAHSVGFLLTLITVFLFAQTIYAFRFSPLVNVVFLGSVSFFLVLQSLWTMELEKNISAQVLHITTIATVTIAQIGWALSFWPIPTTLQALFITTYFYSVTGLSQQHLTARLYKRTLIEYFAVTAIVFIILLLTVRWRATP